MKKSKLRKIKPGAFLDFIRQQGVIGLAIGFILGAAAKEMVDSLVGDIIQPLIGLLLGSTEGLKEVSLTIAGATIRYGNFIATTIDFIVLAAVVYYVFKGLKLDKLDLKKD